MKTRKAPPTPPSPELVKVRGWGRSLGIVLPKHVATKMHVYKGSVTHISIQGGSIVLTPQIGTQEPRRTRRPFSFYEKRAAKLGFGKQVVDEIFPTDERGGEIL